MGKIKNTANDVVLLYVAVQSARGLYGLSRDWILYVKDRKKKA